MKKILIKLRTSIKFIILVSFIALIITGIVAVLYKPIYSVYLNGELIGYCSDKTKLQSKISEYIDNGDEDNDNLAFVSIDNMPTYELCLLKRGITTNDDEIFELVTQSGVSYYKYYAILDGDEEKLYVSDFETAENIITALKEKESDNLDDISITEKYETELVDFVSEDDAVSELYEEKVVVAETETTTSTYSSTESITKKGISTASVSIGITLIKPITGTITSRFATYSRVRTGAHTGLDIAASYGTSIKAAAAGTVTFAGWDSSGLGYLVIINHGNGVETYYGHCSKIYVSVGDTVKQGDVISAVGSTGNSTGNHLHLEVRVNGIAYNPQNYVY